MSKDVTSVCAWPQSRKQLDGCLCELCTTVPQSKDQIMHTLHFVGNFLSQLPAGHCLPIHPLAVTPQPSSQACVGRKPSLPFSLTLPLKGSLPSSQLSAPLSDPASSVLAGLSQEAGDGNSKMFSHSEMVKSPPTGTQMDSHCLVSCQVSL